MRIFTDNSKRDWSLQIDVGAIKRVRGALGVNLLEAIGGDVIERLSTDLLLLTDVVFVVCKPQADERGVSDEQFAAAIFGDAIEKAADCLFSELVDFFPQGQRETLAKIIAKTQEIQSRRHQAAMDALGRPEIDAAIERQVRAGEAAFVSRLNSLGKQSGAAPESSV